MNTDPHIIVEVMGVLCVLGIIAIGLVVTMP